MKDTSLLAYDYIIQEGVKETMYKKIVVALDAIISGTSWDIADKANIRPDQVWKRMNELVDAGTAYDTGKRKNSPNGNSAVIWALVKNADQAGQIEIPFNYRETQTTAADFASKLINGKTKREADSQ